MKKKLKRKLLCLLNVVTLIVTLINGLIEIIDRLFN